MPIRLRILIVDALILTLIGAVAALLLRSELGWPGAVAKAPEGAIEAVLPGHGQDLFALADPGHTVVSAVVEAERRDGLILPGDHVDLSAGFSGDLLAEDVQVLAIDPIGGEIRMTFSLPHDTARKIKMMRATTVLRANLTTLGRGTFPMEFEPPRPSEIIVRRYEEDAWVRRVSTE